MQSDHATCTADSRRPTTKQPSNQATKPASSQADRQHRPGRSLQCDNYVFNVQLIVLQLFYHIVVGVDLALVVVAVVVALTLTVAMFRSCKYFNCAFGAATYCCSYAYIHKYV